MSISTDRIAAATALGSAVLTQLSEISQQLWRIIESLEAEPDYDTTFVVGGVNAGPAVQSIQIPRTIRHARLNLTVDTSVPVSVALFGDNLDIPTVQRRHQAATAGPSGAIISSSGGTVECRDYLNQSGYFTVYFSAAATTYASVRVRSLDRKQPRLRG